MGKLHLASFLLLCLLMTAVACGGSTEVTTAPPVVRGQVVSVEAATITTLNNLVIEDEDRVLWSFIADGPLEFTPSHLREHQVLGLPVIVTYLETAEGLLAVSLTD